MLTARTIIATRQAGWRRIARNHPSSNPKTSPLQSELQFGLINTLVTLAVALVRRIKSKIRLTGFFICLERFKVPAISPCSAKRISLA
jgi:hypothetical protein